MKQAKQIRLLLCAALLLPLAASCQNSNDTSGPLGLESASVMTDTVVNEDVVDPRVEPDLPDNLDFNGHTFTILNNINSNPQWTQTDIAVESQTGESLNDAIFARNLTISEKYNCNIASLQDIGASDKLLTLVKAGDSSVDIVTHYLRNYAVQAQQGLLIDLNEVDTMNLSNPWYDSNSVTEASILNQLYGVASDITLTDKQATGALVFNKSIYADYMLDDSFGDIYSIVRDGKWTFDLLSQMVTSVSADLDGDSKRTEHDRYGLLYQRDTLTSMFTSFNINIASKNSEDIPEMTLMTDRNLAIINEIFDLLYQENYCMNVMAYFIDGYWPDSMVSMFQTGNALMMWIRLRDVDKLRSMDTDFGILPMPKYNENADSYRSAVNSYVATMTCIPLTNYDLSMTGYFIEALAAESHYTVIPEFYNINLQGKVSRDEESREMLDIIFANRHYDLGEIYDPGNIAYNLIFMTMTNNRDIASTWASNEKLTNLQLKKMIEAFSNQ